MSNTSLAPITLHPWVYVLRCQPRAETEYPSLYVGVSLDVHRRITQHLTGRGSRFTQAHPPVAVADAAQRGRSFPGSGKGGAARAPGRGAGAMSRRVRGPASFPGLEGALRQLPRDSA